MISVVTSILPKIQNVFKARLIKVLLFLHYLVELVISNHYCNLQQILRDTCSGSSRMRNPHQITDLKSFTVTVCQMWNTFPSNFTTLESHSWFESFLKCLHWEGMTAAESVVLVPWLYVWVIEEKFKTFSFKM